MNIGLSGEAFRNLLVISLAIGIGIGLLIMRIAKGRGVDISSHRFIVTLGLIVAIVFVGIPFLLTPDISAVTKVGLIAAALAGSIANYFAVDRMHRGLARWRQRRKEERQGRR